MTRTLPPREKLTICFAHVAYRMAERFALRNTGIRHFQVNYAGRADRADRPRPMCCRVSMLWRNNLIATAPQAGIHPVDQRRHRPVSSARR